jgi:uncharacterized ion transporter superfamily protein YfcC
MNYVFEWSQAYLMHFAGWVSFLLAFQVYKKGLPRLWLIPELVKSAIAMALVVGLFSSAAHNHYLSHFLQKPTKVFSK